ncbi:cytochrome P450 [Stereum hirsutum FP-91666 SS1]|uniref:cytochrome P450 n=1 Tax=Stereum hirsutum (strain FP-91666) TaxID=721885 RepID=UPI00044493B1|nr:cytochrome P450 [Stereum hirsutum FP-91666 SS1]EIM81571.1 cytochrome P450 [Stereum hirsutum FP-91666 SS1]
MRLLERSLTTSVLVTSSTVFLLCAALLILSRVRLSYKQAHLRNIPGPPAQTFVFGNLKQFFSLQGWEFHDSIALTYGRIVRIWGLFGDVHLHISDPKSLYNVLIKDQEIFEETDTFIESNKLFFGMGLLSTLGVHHRRQRKLLNPVFSINHMRYMIPTFYSISHQLDDILKAKVDNGPQELDVLEWMTRVALELVGQGGLGYSFETLDERKSNRYAEAVKMLFPTAGRIELLRMFLPYFSNLGTASFRHWAIRLLPSKNIKLLIDATEVMDETSKKVFYHKKEALEKGDDAVVHQMGEGRDIMSILMQSNLTADEDDRMPESELLGQMSTLVFAAMDTTSSALSRILLLLSMNPSVQDKLREELVAARKEAGGDLDYDALHELPYLEAVCRETLRVYPPVTHIPRVARKDAVLPLSTPIRGNDGSTISEIVIPKDTSIIIGIREVNTSTEIWGTDAAQWKPERWLSPLPESVTNARVPGIYSNMLTFLGGGRGCIGFKFSQMEMKIVLSLLIPSFYFSPAKKQIEWLMGPVSAPVVSGGTKPSMPLMLTPVQPQADGAMFKA